MSVSLATSPQQGSPAENELASRHNLQICPAGHSTDLTDSLPRAKVRAMVPKPTRLLASLLFASTIAACSMQPVHFGSVSPTISSPMVASKIETPVFVILDPDAVPDHIVTSRGDAKPVELYEIHSFVTRDVAKTLDSFFLHVDVVDMPPSMEAAHIIVDVKLTKLDTTVDKATAFGSGGSATAYQIYGVMDWAIALRHSTQSEYFFSFSDHVIGDYGGTTVHDTEAMFRSVLEVALARFLTSYVEDEVQQRARESIPS